jgi:hypothetical protein
MIMLASVEPPKASPTLAFARIAFVIGTIAQLKGCCSVPKRQYCFRCLRSELGIDIAVAAG